MVQYKVVEVKNFKSESIESEINKMIQEGWELVTTTSHLTAGITDIIYLIFKKG